jgi:hypothetical protein
VVLLRLDQGQPGQLGKFLRRIAEAGACPKPGCRNGKPLRVLS